MFYFKKLLSYFIQDKSAKAKEKIQNDLITACFSGYIEGVIKNLQLGATFTYDKDPAFLLKEFLEMPGSERHLDTIFQAMPLTPEFLAVPQTKRTKKRALLSQGESFSIFQFVLEHYFLDTAKVFIEHANSKEILDILKEQTHDMRRKGKTDHVQQYNAVLNLIEKKHIIYLEKQMFSDALSSNAPKELLEKNLKNRKPLKI